MTEEDEVNAMEPGTVLPIHRHRGSSEMVDELTGAVVEQGNLDALCEKIKEFSSVGFKPLHSAGCRKRAEACFDKDRCFGEYVELYENLLNK